MKSVFEEGLVRGTVGTTLLVPFVGTTAARHGGGLSGGMGGGMGGFGWWPLLWSLLVLSVLLVVGYGMYVQGRPSADERDHTNDALSTLRSRYARSELSEEEFERRREQLERTG